MSNDLRPDVSSLLTGERCNRLRDVFDRVLDLPEAERGQWIEMEIPDPDDRAALRLLLGAEAGHGPLDMPSTERILRIGAEPELEADGLVGQRIGAFRLMRLLGQGGMAAVFLAEREGAEFRQQVAVKLLRRGLYSAVEQRLFRREQQALAALSHPNIAHLIDGGVSEAGIPFLILEFVDGSPLTQFAAEKALGLPERLRLFVVVCRAVAAAHRQLIVHRDIKPSNILVDTGGHVKLLDFGIAKLLTEEDDGATRAGLGALTPGYAAPEQYAGDAITTATDVFALGVLLQELLLGGRAPDGDTDARRPSSLLQGDATIAWPLPIPRASLVAALKGDLDNIVLKAQASEPERRYASASELADDVERHLDAKPVSAHPPSGWYRTRKFVRRHRGSVALSAAFAIGVLASLGIAVWQAKVARAEAANARAEAQRANTTRDFIEDLFEPVRDQVAEGRMPSLRDLVDTGAAQLDSTSDLAPAQRVDLLMMFARLQQYLAEPGRSLELAEQAHVLAETSLSADSPLMLQALLTLGRVRQRNGDLEGAEPLLREVERRYQAAGIRGPPLIELFAILSSLENERGRPQASLRYAEREFAARLAHFGEDDPGMASGYNNLGYALEAVGRFDEAIDAYEKCLELDDRGRDPRSLERTLPLGNLAQAEFNAGRLTSARRHFEQSLAIHAEVALEKPTRTHLGQLGMLAATEQSLGELERATAVASTYQALAMLTPPNQNDRAIAQRQIAALAFEHGRLQDARNGLDSLEALTEPLSPLSRKRSLSVRDLQRAELALLDSHADQAAVLAQRAVEVMKLGMYPPFPLPYGQALLAQACSTSRVPACAGDTYAVAAEALAKPNYRDHPTMLGAHVALARTELGRGDVETAVVRLRSAAAAAIERGVIVGSPRVAQVRIWLAVALARKGDCTGAAQALAAASTADSEWPDHPLIAEGHTAYRTSNACLPPASPSITTPSI
jgi:serine/threonine protein kinase/tetratricopeptide (TPR) repeat protein